MTDEPGFDPRRKSAIRDLVVTTARRSSSRRGRGPRVAVVATLIVLAVGLSGGVAYAVGAGLLAPDPVVSSSPPATPNGTPAPSGVAPAPTTAPTPPVPAVDGTDPATWLIDFDGVGPATLGRPFEEQRNDLPAFVDITDPLCVDVNMTLQSPSGLPIVFASGGDEPRVTAAIDLSSGSPLSVDLRSATPKTAAGIGLGFTTDELLAAYPGIEMTGAYAGDVEGSPYYGLTNDSGGWIVFGIIEGKVARIQVANEAVVPLENRSVQTLPGERCPA